VNRLGIVEEKFQTVQKYTPIFISRQDTIVLILASV
jgi:hypothetical protein